MWLWKGATAYVWDGGFRQFAATHKGFQADWNTAGFALPALVFLVWCPPRSERCSPLARASRLRQQVLDIERERPVPNARESHRW